MVPTEGQRAGSSYRRVINQSQQCLGAARAKTEGVLPAADRETYPDGRLVPIIGDKVYQMVGGAGGSPASIYGEVFRGTREGRTARQDTRAASIMGGASTSVARPQVQRTLTVVDDLRSAGGAARAKAEQDRKEQNARRTRSPCRMSVANRRRPL